MTFNGGTVLSKDRYLANKEYFDAGLIKTLESYSNKLDKANEKISILKGSIYKKKYTITNLSLKLKEEKIKSNNYYSLIKNKDEELEKVIKDSDKRIKELEKTVNNELDKSYKDNAKLIEENEKLKKEIEELRRKLYSRSKRDSTNSSLPPSSDFSSRHIANSRIKTDLRKGGQINHKGHFSHFRETSNIENRYVKKAPIGAKAILDDNNQVLYYKVQEIDIKLHTIIKEIRYYVSEDNKEVLSDDELNRYKINSVSYTNDFKAVILLFNNYANVSLNKLSTIFNNISDNDISINPSTICKWNKEFSRKSKDDYDNILKSIINDKVIGVDETSWRVNAKNNWMHTICNDDYSYYVITDKRSSDKGPLDILKDYKGILVHDHFKPYYHLDTSMQSVMPIYSGTYKLDMT